MVDRELQTTRQGVFAAGDVVLGPATVIQAVAQGNQVARSVDAYLMTGDATTAVILPGYEVVEQQFNLDDYADAKRPHVQELAVEKRQGNFDEVEPCMPEVAVREECKRCLRCDLEWLQTFNLPLKARPDRPATEEEFALLKRG